MGWKRMIENAIASAPRTSTTMPIGVRACCAPKTITAIASRRSGMDMGEAYADVE